MKLTTLKPRLATLVTQRIPTQQGTERLRGRAAVDRRRRWLDAHPLCVECERAGRVTAATQADHAISLWAGGQDSLETNGNPLCDSHHEAKTACEARMRAAGGWLSTPCQCGQHAHGPA